MTNTSLRVALAALLIALCASVALAGDPTPRWPAGNLLKNVGFENGAKKWTVSSNTGKDKVKCGITAVDSSCAFRFKGTSVAHKATLKQVITPATAGRGTREAIVANAKVWLQALSGTSCVAASLTVKFNNPETETLKATYATCNGGGTGVWSETQDFGPTTSFGENSYKKIVLKIKHTGVGVWLVDGALVEFEAK